MRVWWEVEYWENYNKGIENDVLLVAKQWMVFAHIRCPKPPIRYARGLLQSTIRIRNDSYNGMAQVSGFAGNKQAYYTPYTNEKWISPRWHGKQNPNYWWFDDSVHDVCRLASGKGVQVKW